MPEDTPELKIISQFGEFIIYQFDGRDYKVAFFKPKKDSTCEGWYEHGRGDQDYVCQLLKLHTETELSKEDLKKKIFGASG